MTIRRRRQRANVSSEPWLPAEELRLRELAGAVEVRDIARILTLEFHVPRTKHAVKAHARVLDLSLWWDGYSQNQVAELFGVGPPVVCRWRQEGLLQGEAWGRRGRGRFGQWRFTQVDIASFITSYPWAYDLEYMVAGAFRSRAEVAHRADPWLRLPDAARLVGLHPDTFRHKLRQGLIPYQRRVAGVGSAKMMIRASDLTPHLREDLRRLALVNIREGIARRDQRRRAA